jgi:glycerol uptake facilitator-like aquaporin
MDEKIETATAQVETEAAMSPYIDLPAKYDRWEPVAEVVATIVLALATLATAWSGYQAARWGGEMSTSYSQAGALRTESNRASNQAGQQAQVDIGIFANWINAFAADNQELANFYQDRFREEFVPAFDAWIATDPVNNPDAPSSPFEMPQYKLQLIDESIRLEKEAEATFAAGAEANQISDEYILTTVILAGVLFLAGIASRFKAMSARWVIIIFSLAILVYGLFNILRYPIQ